MCLSWESHECHEQYQTNLCSEECLWKIGHIWSWIRNRTYPENRMLYILDTASLLRKNPKVSLFVFMIYPRRRTRLSQFYSKNNQNQHMTQLKHQRIIFRFSLCLKFYDNFMLIMKEKIENACWTHSLELGFWGGSLVCIPTVSQARQGKALRLSHFRFVLDWGRNFVSSE